MVGERPDWNNNIAHKNTSSVDPRETTLETII
jgi:hypothetical protein